MLNSGLCIFKIPKNRSYILSNKNYVTEYEENDCKVEIVLKYVIWAKINSDDKFNANAAFKF